MRRPVFVVVCGWIGGKAVLVVAGGASSTLVGWVVWATIAGLVWFEEPRWHNRLSPPTNG